MTLLLLGKFNSNNDLEKIINCYQEYFVFKVKKKTTLLYLDTKILHLFLKKGFDIKYRNFIFLFLKNNIKTTNSSYKFINKFDNKTLDNYILQKINKLFNNNDYDIKNIENIINISDRIIKKNNLFKLIEKNIIKLENNFYANTTLSRFLHTKNIFNYFKYDGIIINNSIDKNRLYSLISINYYNKNYNLISNLNKSDLKQISTKCTIILTEKNNINTWIDLIKYSIHENKIYKIITKKDLKNLYNKDILNIDFLIINVNFINNKYFKNYYNKYNVENNKSFCNLIINSIYDNLFNKNILNEKLNNLYIFKWNNIIFDDIEKIQYIDKNNFINYLSTNNIKYYLLNNNINDSNNINNKILDYVINNSIINIKNKIDNEFVYTNNINIEYDNFYNFIKKELLIKDNKESNIIYNFIKVSLDNNELNLYKNLFDLEDNKKKSLFLMNSSNYNFNINTIDQLSNINELYYNNLITKEYEKLEILNNFFKNKDEKDSCTNFINEYFNKKIINDNEINENILITKIKSDINKYKSKIEYFQNIINNLELNNYVCSICMENIDNNNLCIINCGHSFCKNCLTNYVIQQDKKCKCPICRDSFLLNNVYVPIKNKYDIEKIIINGSKLNKLKDILYNENNKNNNNEKIIIVTQYKENIKIKNEIEENYYFFNLFYKNNNLNNIKKESFIKSINKSILLCNYFDIIDYKFDDIKRFIFIDYPIVEELNDIFIQIKNIYIDLNNDINFYFLYTENTFEEKIISGLF
jgi:hypothetical protein